MAHTIRIRPIRLIRKAHPRVCIVSFAGAPGAILVRVAGQHIATGTRRTTDTMTAAFVLSSSWNSSQSWPAESASEPQTAACKSILHTESSWHLQPQRISSPPPPHKHRDSKDLTRISHSPPAAIAYLMPSPGLVLIADFDVFQYAFTRLTATSPGSVAIYAISLRSL